MAPNWGNRRPVGDDRYFGEDKKLEPYVNTVMTMENGTMKSFEIYVESSCAGLGHMNIR